MGFGLWPVHRIRNMSVWNRRSASSQAEVAVSVESSLNVRKHMRRFFFFWVRGRGGGGYYGTQYRV